MTKSFGNFTSSSNKSKNAKNDSIDADKLMDDLNMEEFQKVLDQVVDFSLPDSKKSPLVQKLNQDAKEENFLEAPRFENPQKSTKFKPNLKQNAAKLNNNSNSPIGYEPPTRGEAPPPPPGESHLQKLESFCDSFETNCTLASSLLTNCAWDTKRPGQLNGTCKASDHSSDSFTSFATSSATESSQQAIHNHLSAQPENSTKCCDNLNCDSCKQQRSKPIYVSNAGEELAFEMKDYSRRAKLVEYSSNRQFINYADLKDANSETTCEEAKLVKPFRTENYSNSLESSSYYDHSICQDGKPHGKLSSSTSDGYISSLNAYYENDTKSFLKKGSTSSSIQANGKFESHLKKRKKPERKLAQEVEGYVGYRDIAYLTEYVTGSDSKSAIENTGKEMNVKKKDKKELNGLKEKKKNGKEISSSASNATDQPEKAEPAGNATSGSPPDASNVQVANDLTNDKNNNLTTASTETIPNSSSTDHSSAASSDSTVRRESGELSSGKTVKDSVVPGETNNPSNQTKGNKGNSAEKGSKATGSSAGNQSRKSSSANTEISNDRQQSNQSANSNQSSGQRSVAAAAATNEDQPVKSGSVSSATITSIVSNGLHGLDSMYIVSDSEVPDQEGDFKIVKYKQLRRKKQKRGSNQEDHSRLTGHGNDLSGQGRGAAGKRDRQRSSAVQNPATARGYESESDYCAVEGRKKQRDEMQRDTVLLNNSGRKSNSMSNSDSDSINSSNEEATNRLTGNLMNTGYLLNSTDPTPFESAGHFAPSSTLSNHHVPYSKISYAAITKMHYSNAAANGATNSSNLTSNANPASTGNQPVVSNQPAASSQPALETRRESLNDKKNTKNPTNDKNKATQKSITNPAESPKSDESAGTKGKELGKPDSRKTSDERKQSQDKPQQDKPQQDKPQQDKQAQQQRDKQPKRLTKADSAEAERTAANTAELELSTTDHSRTDSIDLNHPSYLSSKSNSINSTQQPPVIMLDNKSTDQDTPFTFGFFNENAQLQNNADEANDEQPEKSFSPVADVNEVNFTSKESAARQSHAKSETPNHAEKSDEERTVEPTGKPRSSNVEAPVSNSINLDVIMNSSPVGNQPAPNFALNSAALHGNTPICAGTYIMESSEDYSAHDNITKKIGHDARSSGDQRRSTHINDLTSINLTKLKEKFTSPNEQPAFRHDRPVRPEFTCNVAYIQAVNYVRRAWEDVKNSKPVYKPFNGPVMECKLVIERVEGI